MKKVLAFTLATLMAFMLFGCSSTPAGNPPSEAAVESESTLAAAMEDPAAEAEKAEPNSAAPAGDLVAFDEFARPKLAGDIPYVAFLNTQLQSSGAQQKERQFMIEVNHRGWKYEYVVIEDDSEFRDAFQSLINLGVDAIFLSNLEKMDAKVDLIAEARNAGIGVYNIDNQVVKGIVANSTQQNATAAIELLYAVGEAYSWDANLCTMQAYGIQVHHERIDTVKALCNGNSYPNFVVIAEEDLASTELAPQQAAYEFTQAWMQQYGEDVDIIYCPWDGGAIGAAEAIMQAGDAHGDKTITVSTDGGNDAWAYLRNDTPLKFCYNQPFELYAHNIFEAFVQIQVEGMQPGDSGCLINRAGETIAATGSVATVNNCPEPGWSIHQVFNFYGGDPNDAEAWYNWTDGPGILYLSE